MPRKDSNTGPISAQAQQDLVSEGIENFELPKSLVAKIAKSAIPDSAKLQKETVLSLVKGSTVFINYLAATAHDVALSKQHKSISASDVLKALEMIEFGDFVDALQNELQIYREHAKTDKSKKGSANINSASSNQVPSGSKGKAKDTFPTTSPSAKSKGKEKEKLLTLPSPFTSVPLSAPAGASYEFGATAEGMSDAVEGGDHVPVVGGEPGGEDIIEEGLEEEVEEADTMDEVEELEEEEEMQDVVLDEEPLQRDARDSEEIPFDDSMETQ